MNREDAPAHFPSQVLGTNASGMEMLLLTPSLTQAPGSEHTHVVSALFNTSIKKTHPLSAFSPGDQNINKCLAMQEELGVLSVCVQLLALPPTACRRNHLIFLTQF